MTTHLSFAAKRTRKIEAQQKKAGTFIRNIDFSDAVVVDLSTERKSSSENVKRNYDCLSSMLKEPPKDQWDQNSYEGSSCYMSRSEDGSVNLLASDDNKENKKRISHGRSGKSIFTKAPIKQELPTHVVVDACVTTRLSDDDNDNVTINLLEEEIEEREARRKSELEVVQSMMDRTAGYPGGEEPRDDLEPCPAQPEMGTVCVWCGEEPCEWVKVEFPIGEYYRLQVKTLGQHNLPPHNIMRKRMYRQVAMEQGFVRREKLPHCIHLGIMTLSPSPDGNYMGHMYI